MQCMTCVISWLDRASHFVVQVMCAVEDPAASHAILLAHADPGQRHCIRPGERSEVLLSLPCGSTGSSQTFVMGTTSELPDKDSLFTASSGHAKKASLQSLRNTVEISRGPLTVFPSPQPPFPPPSFF